MCQNDSIQQEKNGPCLGFVPEAVWDSLILFVTFDSDLGGIEVNATDTSANYLLHDVIAAVDKSQ